MSESHEVFNEATAATEPSAEQIQQTIVAKEKEISESISELSERIQEKLDWREYVGQYPYAALGIAAGVGLIASRMLPKRPTAMGRIMGTVGEEVGAKIRGVLRGTGRATLGISLWSIASSLAMSYAQRAVSNALLGDRPKDTSSPQCGTTREKEAAERQTAANA